MLVQGFGGCLPAEGFAGPVVESESNGLEFVGLPSRQVRALGEVLAQQPVGVLVGAPLPGAVRVGEVDLQPGVDAELDIRLSVGRTGQCWGNALAEPFFATLKNELFGDRPWPSRSFARTAVFEWIEGWYNLHRLHSSLGYRSPADYEAALAA
jgi:hypothetical protein